MTLPSSISIRLLFSAFILFGAAFFILVSNRPRKDDSSQPSVTEQISIPVAVMEQIRNLAAAVLMEEPSSNQRTLQVIGRDICSCAPNTYEFQLDFGLFCPPVNVTQGDAVASTTCLVNPFIDPDVDDLIPVSVKQIDILELNQRLRLIVQETIVGTFKDGDTFSYTSHAADPSQIEDPVDVPRAIQLNLIGDNHFEQSIINLYLILFTNDCQAFPVLFEGQSAGWTVFSKLGAPSSSLCPISIHCEGILSCPGDITIGNDKGKCSAHVTYEVIACTQDSEVHQIAGLAPGESFPVGTTKNTWEAIDSAGNIKDSCSFDVIVTDNERPVLTCPDDVEADVNTGRCSASIEIPTATVVDNCDSLIPQADPSMGPFELGKTDVRYMVEDNAGNWAQCYFRITVEDKEEIDMEQLSCGTSTGVMRPCDAPMSFTPSYSNNNIKGNGCAVYLTVDNPACQFCNANGKEIDKLNSGSCVVSINTDNETNIDNFKVDDSGGIGDFISFDVMVEDDSGRSNEAKCTVCVERGGCHAHLRRQLKPANRPFPFECPGDWDPFKTFHDVCDDDDSPTSNASKSSNSSNSFKSEDDDDSSDDDATRQLLKTSIVELQAVNDRLIGGATQESSIILGGILKDGSKVTSEALNFLLNLSCLYHVPVHVLVGSKLQMMQHMYSLLKMQTYPKGIACSPIEFVQEPLYIAETDNRIDRLMLVREYQRSEIKKIMNKTDHLERSVVMLSDLDLIGYPFPMEIMGFAAAMSHDRTSPDVLCAAGIEKYYNNDEEAYYDTFATILLPDTFLYPLGARVNQKVQQGEDPSLIINPKKFTNVDALRWFKTKGSNGSSKGKMNAVPVKSCFGGLALYRASKFLDDSCSYDRLNYELYSRYANRQDHRVCEHVVFNVCLQEKHENVTVAVQPDLRTWRVKEGQPKLAFNYAISKLPASQRTLTIKGAALEGNTRKNEEGSVRRLVSAEDMSTKKSQGNHGLSSSGDTGPPVVMFAPYDISVQPKKDDRKNGASTGRYYMKWDQSFVPQLQWLEDIRRTNGGGQTMLDHLSKEKIITNENVKDSSESTEKLSLVSPQEEETTATFVHNQETWNAVLPPSVRDQQSAASITNLDRRIVWLLSFPNSGTSYTLQVTREASGISTATTYGEEINGQLESIFDTDQISIGPYWVPSKNSIQTQGLVLTKTHCRGYCHHCAPDKFFGSQREFTLGCLQYSKYDAAELPTKHYSSDLVKKSVHLIRDPFDNMVSRFHHAKALKQTNNQEVYLYSEDRQGFRHFCEEDKFSCIRRSCEDKVPFYDKFKTSIEHEKWLQFTSVPCYTDLIRYVMWHNHAFQMVRDMNLSSMLIYFEDYSNNWNGTVSNLLNFLEYRQKSSDIDDFIKGKTYHNFYTPTEIRAAEVAMKRLSSEMTWSRIKHYFIQALVESNEVYRFTFPSIEQRLKYYMGAFYEEKQAIFQEMFCDDIEFYTDKGPTYFGAAWLFNKKHLEEQLTFEKSGNSKPPYAKETLQYIIPKLKNPDTDVLAMHMGDNRLCFDLPVLTKARPLECPDGMSGIIMPLNRKRHFNVLENVKNRDRAWSDKRTSLLWRGDSTGHGKRAELVKSVINMYPIDDVDIGFSEVVDEGLEDEDNLRMLLKPRLDLREQLKYKYLLSLEGNDVASGLKWMLYSNSVVFMPPPTIVSWAMEDQLVPYFHYVPLEPDLSDLYDKILWARANDELCEQISKQATKFMEDLWMSDQAKKDNEDIISKIVNRYQEYFRSQLLQCSAKKNKIEG